MTDYLQLARERAAGAPPSDAANPYMGIAQENQRRQETQLRAIVERALKDDPELAAERQRLSQTSGLPLSTTRCFMNGAPSRKGRSVPSQAGSQSGA